MRNSNTSTTSTAARARLRRSSTTGSSASLLSRSQTAEDEHAGDRRQRQYLRLSSLRRRSRLDLNISGLSLGGDSGGGGSDAGSVEGSFHSNSSRTFSLATELDSSQSHTIASQSNNSRDGMPSNFASSSLERRRGSGRRASSGSFSHRRNSNSSLNHELAETFTHDRRSFGVVRTEVTLLRMSLELDREAKMAEALGKSLRKEFEKIDIVGREEEVALLRDILHRLEQPPDATSSTSSRQKEMVLLHGPSGTGKTTLVNHLSTTMKENDRGVLVRGKYDLQRSKGQPLTGLALACNELCSEFLQETHQKMREEIAQELRENIDGALLEHLGVLIPRLPLLLAVGSVSCGVILEDVSSSRLSSSQRSETGDISASSREQDPATQDAEDPSESSTSKPKAGFRKRSKPKKESPKEEGSSVSSLPRRNGEGVSKQQLQFSMRTFLRVVSTKLQEAKSVLVLVLDDLQWADLPSLEILQEVARDPNISNLMLICCYRSAPLTTEVEAEEEKRTKAFVQSIAQLKLEHEGNHGQSSESAKDTGCSLTEITIGNFSLEVVNQLLAEVLSVPAEDILGLAQICYKRTLGNAFFVKMFLMTLEEKGMLTFQVENGNFAWDLAEVEEETAATENVVDLIQAKLSGYAPDMLLLLQLGASLGNSFDLYILELLWDSFVDQSQESSSEATPKLYEKTALPELLDQCVDDMLLEPLGGQLISEYSPSFPMSTSYKFVHDKIQLSVMSYIPAHQFDSFRSAVGRCLFHRLDEEELEGLLFVVADLLNNGMNTGTAIAELNLMAAEKAKDFSAFLSALRYVESGIMCLNGCNMWDDYPDLALDLFSAGAEAAEAAGNTEKSDWYCSQVSRQQGISTLDKMRVNNIIVERLYSNGKYDELWTKCMDILDKLGCKLPRMKKLQDLEASLCLKQAKRYVPDALDVDQMAIIQDQKRREGLAFMIKAASFGMGSNHKSLYIVLCCRCVRWTKKYGVTASAASVFASFANVLMHEQGDWNTALKIAELALTIESRFGTSYTKTSTLQKTNSFVLGWVKPLRNCRTNYTKAYKLGMLSGNIEGVGMAVLFLLMCQFFSGGTSLVGLESDLKKYIPHLEKLKLHTYALGLRMLWQKVLNLIGANDFNPQTTSLIGTAVHGIDMDKHPFIYSTAGRHHIVNMCACFSEYEKGAGIAIEMGGIFYKSWSGAAYFGFETFPRAVCLYAMAIKSGGQQKYLKPARKARAEIAKWVKQGAINLLHQLYMLDAEDAVVKGNEKQAKSLFIKAISTAVRGGFLCDAGIANERYAVYLESLPDDTDAASHHMKEAVNYFSEWGAARKVRLLREKHSKLLDRLKTLT